MSVSLTSALNSLNNSSSASGTSASTDSATQLNQQFLSLLVAQMNNQDPLNPVSNSELTSQMAQISTVSGVNQVNTSVENLITQFQQSESLQATQMTGKAAIVSGSTMTESTAGGGSAFGFNLASAADTVKATILDSNGNVVNTFDIGATGTGMQLMSWDGKDSSGNSTAAGNYTIKITASSNGSNVSATTYGEQIIEGSSQSNGSVEFTMSGGSTVPMSSIEQYLS